MEEKEVPQVWRSGFIVSFRAETEAALDEIFTLAETQGLSIICGNRFHLDYTTKYLLQGDVLCQGAPQAEMFFSLLSAHRPYDPTV
jgi:hypothetical protein